jgi:hypothetical protein
MIHAVIVCGRELIIIGFKIESQIMHCIIISSG